MNSFIFVMLALWLLVMKQFWVVSIPMLMTMSYCAILHVQKSYVVSSLNEEMCDKMGIVSHTWLMSFSHKLQHGVRLKHLMFQMRDDFRTFT